ncbi:DUF4252 domain-containing protein [Galbibacter pacificus]|uniref:DUF4252 domain-containing protein n=1 Tax=Galbibacter pacificus TaxID=2996052 RepID=A0ABT6FMN8_9FLAO|nr:DUF4252 domain-containing protein [Galbibacter pacificus]MDG3581032.1 DUF4252 domain-containing protein [Galbibacter pacificus]MDG3584510.1 DUF4252 domain-containing protein [Galbibacter pacificus]
MRKIAILAAVSFLIVSCGASTPYDSFRKENKKDIAFSLSASNFLVKMFVDDEDFREINKVVSGIHKYRVLISEEESSQYLENEFDDFVQRKGYESLMYVNSDGSKVGLFYYQKRNKIKEVLLKVKDDEDFVVLSAEGNIKIKDLDRLVNNAVAEIK